MSDTPRAATQLVTYTPGMTSPRWLGSLGHINGLNYGSLYPGGCDQLSATLAIKAQATPDALRVGRRVQGWRGGSCVYDGILDEAVAGATGWSITAHGNGTYGASYKAYYTTWSLNDPVNQAISRGLPWRNPGISSGWLGQVVDPASITITDFMNNLTLQAGLGWFVDVRQQNLLTTGPIPSTPNRIIVITVPNPRTLAAGLNLLWYKYVSADNKNGSQAYSFGNVSSAQASSQHGNLEDTIDLTGAGLMTAGAAQANAQAILNLYVRANFSGSFTIRRGQLMTLGGSAIDLGTEQAGTVCRAILTDGGYGGEVVPSPLTFVTGGYTYDDDSQTATVTPLQSYKSDLQTLLTAVVPKLRQ